MFSLFRPELESEMMDPTLPSLINTVVENIIEFRERIFTKEIEQLNTSTTSSINTNYTQQNTESQGEKYVIAMTDYPGDKYHNLLEIKKGDIMQLLSAQFGDYMLVKKGQEQGYVFKTTIQHTDLKPSLVHKRESTDNSSFGINDDVVVQKGKKKDKLSRASLFVNKDELNRSLGTMRKTNNINSLKRGSMENVPFFKTPQQQGNNSPNFVPPKNIPPPINNPPPNNPVPQKNKLVIKNVPPQQNPSSTPPQQPLPNPPQQSSGPPQQPLPIPPQQINPSSTPPQQPLPTLPQQSSVPPQQPLPIPPQQLNPLSTPPQQLPNPPQEIPTNIPPPISSPQLERPIKSPQLKKMPSTPESQHPSQSKALPPLKDPLKKPKIPLRDINKSASSNSLVSPPSITLEDHSTTEEPPLTLESLLEKVNLLESQLEKEKNARISLEERLSNLEKLLNNN